MGRKGGVKEKFSICRFRLKKVKKVSKLRSGDKKICDAGARHMPNQESGCAAGLPGGCYAGFPRKAQILHAARNGHIVPLPFGPGRIELISRQRALSTFTRVLCRIFRKDASLANPLPVATLLDSASSSHRLTAPRYGLSSYCGRSLFTSEEDMRPSPQGLGKERDATHSAPRG